MVTSKSLPLALAVLGFVACLAFVPGTLAFATIPKWAVLCCGAGVLIFFITIRPSPGHWAGLALIAYAVASLWWATVPLDGGLGLGLLALSAALFCIGAECDDLGPLYRFLALGLIPSVLTMMVTKDWETDFWWNPNPIGGLFGNRNYVGELAAPVFIGLIEWRLPLMVFSPAMALVLSECRGALLAIGATAALAMWSWSRIAAVALVALAVFAFGFSLKHPWAVSAMRERVVIWQDAWDGLTPFGRGIGQYRATVPDKGWRMASLFKDSWHAHSDPLELVYELGPGALLAVAIVAIAFRGPGRRRDKMVLACFLIEGCVGLPYHEPMGLFVGSVVAGHLCGADRRLRDRMASGLHPRGHRQPRREARHAAPRRAAARVTGFSI